MIATLGRSWRKLGKSKRFGRPLRLLEVAIGLPGREVELGPQEETTSLGEIFFFKSSSAIFTR